MLLRRRGRIGHAGLTLPQQVQALFAAGEQGAWYDPSDLSTLFQDSAGTTPVTAVDQPVGLMRDKSGRGNHASQATDTRRPLLKQDASGFYHLLFDGVDDYLRATFEIAQPIDRISGLSFITWNQFRTVLGGVTAIGGLLQQGSVSLDLRVNSGSSTLPVSVPMLTPSVITERHNGASSRIALNSGAYATGNGGATLPGGITIASNEVAAAFRDLRFYGSVMRGGATALSDSQIAVIRRYAAGLCGVAL